MSNLSSTSPVESFWRRFSFAGPYAPLLMLFVVGLPVLAVSRAILMFWQSERVAATGVWPEMLLQGARADLIMLGFMSVPMLLLMPFLATRRFWRGWLKVSAGWLVAMLTTLVFFEISTPSFITEYDSRPNRLFIDYLMFPGEVLPMLWEGFRTQLVGGIVVTTLAFWLSMRLARPWRSTEARWTNLRMWLVWPVVFLLCMVAIRSTVTAHRPANPSTFAITTDPMVNTLVISSAYSVAFAAYSMRYEANSSEMYGKMPENEIMAEVKRMREKLGDTRPYVGDKEIPTLIEHPAGVKRDKPLNLVIVLEESLGATFVESLGGKPVTPEIEKLKHEGWWFEQLYCTGTRSVRGIEAVTTGFMPTPANAVVRLTRAQRNFANLANILGQHGYQSEFIYGGEGHFDNMRNFFLGNGYSKVTDQHDYKNPTFVASWGVSDEDLFNKAHERLEEKHRQGIQSYTLVFTSTNHAPFEFPDGRIELFEQPKQTDYNAVKYTDWALGRFIEKAKKSDYWKDTIFLIVADHDIRIRGDALMAVERFHIPGLVLGHDIKPKRIKTVASQIDLPPTMLSLMGVSTRHPMPGRDLTTEPEGHPGRAMMQNMDTFAWMEGEKDGKDGDRVVVLRPGKPPAHARYDRNRKHLDLAPAPADAAELEKRALAHSLLPAWLYREQRYRVPEAAEK